MIVDELISILGYDIKGEDKLRRYSQSLDQLVSRMRVVAAATATLAAAGVGMLGRAVINTSAEFEVYQATLETVEGSAEKAAASLDWVSEFAKTTPYDVAQVTESFIRMRAYGLDPMDGSLRAVGDAASAMGRTIMDGVEAIADATTGENERLKAFGITTEVAGKKITYTWRENGKELKKTLDKNGVEIAKFLQENFERRFGGAMDKQSKTWNGMVSNIGDSWTDFQRRIGDAGFFDAAKGQLQRLVDFIARLDADGTLDRWAQSISDSLTTVVNFIGGFVDRVALNLGTIADLLNANAEAWNILKAVALGLAIGLFPVIAAFVGAALVLDDFLTYLRGGKSVIGDAIQWLGELKDAILAWIAALPDRISEGIANAFRAGFEGAKAVVMEFVNWANEKLAALNPLNYLSSGSDAPANDNTAGSVSLRPEQVNTDLQQLLNNLDNAQANVDRMGGDRAAASVESTVNDSRNQSVTVNVGGVNVQQASQAPAAVGQAVGNAAAGAARSPGLPPTRISGTGAF